MTGAVQDEAVTLSSQAADYRFTELDDEVQNYGWGFTLPFDTRRSVIELSGGWQHARKARTYRQSQFSIGALSVADVQTLQRPLDEVFSDSVALHLDWRETLSQPRYATFVEDERVQEAIQRWEDEEAALRGSVESYFADMHAAR